MASLSSMDEGDQVAQAFVHFLTQGCTAPCSLRNIQCGFHSSVLVVHASVSSTFTVFCSSAHTLARLTT